MLAVARPSGAPARFTDTGGSQTRGAWPEMCRRAQTLPAFFPVTAALLGHTTRPGNPNEPLICKVEPFQGHAILARSKNNATIKPLRTLNARISDSEVWGLIREQGLWYVPVQAKEALYHFYSLPHMSVKRLKVGFGLQIKIVMFICMLLFGIELVNLFTGRYLNQFGLIPRSLPSLPGIIISPFLHGSFLHFVSNIIPLAIFSFLMLQHGVRRFARVTAACILVSGLLIWLLGRNAIHVGASGLIYGYFAYLLLAGIFSKEIKLIAISLLVGFGYGGLIFGVLPVNPYISWESHLFGFIVGIGSAFLWGNDAHSSILPAQ